MSAGSSSSAGGALLVREADPERSLAAAHLGVTRARERALAALERTEHELEHLTDWRAFVRRHPYVAVGSALTAGYLLGRLFCRR